MLRRMLLLAPLNIRLQGGYYVDQRQSMMLAFECDPAAEEVRRSEEFVKYVFMPYSRRWITSKADGTASIASL